jgi:hypothetical protein
MSAFFTSIVFVPLVLRTWLLGIFGGNRGPGVAAGAAGLSIFDFSAANGAPAAACIGPADRRPLAPPLNQCRREHD